MEIWRDVTFVEGQKCEYWARIRKAGFAIGSFKLYFHLFSRELLGWELSKKNTLYPKCVKNTSYTKCVKKYPVSKVWMEWKSVTAWISLTWVTSFLLPGICTKHFLRNRLIQLGGEYIKHNFTSYFWKNVSTIQCSTMIRVAKYQIFYREQNLQTEF